MDATKVAGVFGPQTEEGADLIESLRGALAALKGASLIERARSLTCDDFQRLNAAWGAVSGDGRDAAYDAALSAASGAARVAAYASAQAAAYGAAYDAVGDAAGDASWDMLTDAAAALAVRDLIGQGRFTQAHYDTLTGPWRRAIGPLHPDDAALDGDRG